MAQNYEELSAERKALQAKGWLPKWYTSFGYQMFKSKYSYGGEEGVKGRWRTIAKTLSQYAPGDVSEWEDKFFNLMWNGWLSPASPVLANVGTDRGMPVSCSGQYVGDSVDSFYSNLRESALLSKYGFGCSGDFSDIRPRGSSISTGGKASGVVPVIEDFAIMTSKISQGGNRRGSTASYVTIDHGDFDELVDKLEAEPDGFNIGWIVNDDFIEKLKYGDAEANRRFSRALYVKLVTGKGYFFFKDKANRARPKMYKDLGLDIKASNLCVAPETVILTNKGYEVISELEGEDVVVWNGKEWSDVTVVKTGENQELITVKTHDGFELDCTPYHKFYVQKDYTSGKVVETRAQDLRPGDKLIKLETPVIAGDKTLDKAYINGFYSGDGCCVNGRSRIYLYGDKRKLRERFYDTYQHYVQENQDREYFYVSGLKHKFFVPSAEYDVNSRVAWFSGLLDSDGTVTTNGKSQTLQISSVQEGFLESVQLMLQTLGVQSKVVHMRNGGVFPLPANDGTGRDKDFYCKAVKRLLVNGMGIVKLKTLGLDVGRLNLNGHIPNRDAAGFVRVESVEFNGRRDDTYCFNEPKRHMGVFNGLLTGQCSEIMLHSSEQLSYSCILSSMNLEKYDEWKDTTAIFDSMVFLDCLCSYFIEVSEGVPGLEKVRKFTQLGRATGMGVMGFATYLQSKGIPYESLEAQFLNNEIFKKLYDETLRASQYLAQELGEPEWCKGYGVRNTHRTALAPTKSSSILMGGVSESVFPDPGMVFEQSSAAGGMQRINPNLYKIMIERGVYNKKTIDDIVQNLGSVQHVDWLSQDEKWVFKTAFEINQGVILRYASQRQKYLCQGQSLNFFFAEDEQHISEIFTKAFLDENILSIYYIYSRSGITVSGECVACHA